MSERAWTWLIGAKIVCCGALLLVLTGVVSVGGIAAVLTGNALPIAGGGMVALTLVHRWLRRRAVGPHRAMLHEE